MGISPITRTVYTIHWRNIFRLVADCAKWILSLAYVIVGAWYLSTVKERYASICVMNDGSSASIVVLPLAVLTFFNGLWIIAVMLGATKIALSDNFQDALMTVFFVLQFIVVNLICYVYAFGVLFDKDCFMARWSTKQWIIHANIFNIFVGLLLVGKLFTYIFGQMRTWIENVGPFVTATTVTELV